MPTAAAVLPISSTCPHMATAGGRVTRRRSRGDTFTEDEAREREMPAMKRRREDRKMVVTGAGSTAARAVSAAIVQAKVGGAYIVSGTTGRLPESRLYGFSSGANQLLDC